MMASAPEPEVGPSTAVGVCRRVIADSVKGYLSQTSRDVNHVDVLVARLFALHGRQWALEDASRAQGAADVDVATAKRAIDESNAERVRCINAIDTQFPCLLAPDAKSRIPWPMTVGQAIDQLAISAIKVQQIVANQDGAVSSLAHGIRSFQFLIGLLGNEGIELPPVSTIKEYRTDAKP
jgi:hypothetical protein